MSYLFFNDNIEKSIVKTIFELGSRDLVDAKNLINHYCNAKCYSFECNPDCLIECKKQMEDFTNEQRNRIFLIEKAVCIQNKKTNFYPFDLNIYDNMGSSSMFEIDFSIRDKNDPDYNRKNVQKEIEVDGIRLDYYMEKNNIQNVDLLCIDLQGYELEALKSLGEQIQKSRYIITECSIQSTYKQGCTFTLLNSYLEHHGFKYKRSNRFGYNFPNLNMKGFSEFDALFVNQKI